jgi:DNA-directed RNA polymerase specialized sigma24 family protein
MKRDPTQPPKPSLIPEFKTYEEEAEFWDTHSPLDFPDEFEEVNDIVFIRPLKITRESAREEFVQAVAALPEEQRQVLAFSLLGMSVQEISSIMGWSPSKSKRVIREAKRLANVAA